MSSLKLKDLEKIDLTSIEKPKLEKRPTKPTKPTTLAKAKIERTVYWKSTSTAQDFDLINEVLKKVPKTVDVGTLKVWIETTGGMKTTYVGTVSEIPNPRYVEFQRELREYDAKLKEWESKKTAHDERVELFEKYRSLIDASKQKSGLKDRLAKVSEKLRAIGV